MWKATAGLERASVKAEAAKGRLRPPNQLPAKCGEILLRPSDIFGLEATIFM